MTVDSGIARAVTDDFLAITASMGIDDARTILIRDWFSQRWLRFSGKTLGQLGVRIAALAVPPFVPERVREESAWIRSDEAWTLSPPSTAMHRHMASEAATRRTMREEFPGVAALWLGVSEQDPSRLSVMTYLPAESDEYWCFYASLAERCGGWKPDQLKDIGPNEWCDRFPSVSSSAERDAHG